VWPTTGSLYREFLARLPAHSAIAVKPSRSYGWLVDEMELLSHRARLANPASQRNPARSVDSAGRVARSTRTASRVTTSRPRGGSVRGRTSFGARHTITGVAESCNNSVEQELATLDFLETQIESGEKRLEAMMKLSVEADLLKTLPCVGKILSMVLQSGSRLRSSIPPAAPDWCRACIPAATTRRRMGQICET
jgi:hypothetical protein